MLHLVIGTAGHIDHGKTSLVQALTGINADRLVEEKQRGITIDIGFAHTRPSPELTLGFVDLPGHERFMKNMLAGIHGISALLFVVAADESIKPQTREHFEVCRLLGISRGVIALTKCDLVDTSTLDLVRLEVAELVQDSFLAAAPIVAVSSVTGAGIELLREELVAIAAETPLRSTQGYFRLPVDRAFSIKGFGTVATGTMIAGSLDLNDEVELYPIGRRLRVRSLQVHGQPARSVASGERVAINLVGIEPSEVHRGMVLSEPGRFRPASRLDCVYQPVAGAKPVKPRLRVHFHSGAAELQAEIRTIGPDSQIRIVLREPLLILPGDRFILRSGSPLTTIGGGAVLAIDAPKRSPAIQTIAEAIAATGLDERSLRHPAPDRLLIEPDLLVNRGWLAQQTLALEASVQAFHVAEPLKPGLPRPSVTLPMPLLDHILATSETLVCETGLIRHRSHKIVLQEHDTDARAIIEKAFSRANLTVPSTSEVLAASGLPLERAKAILQILIRERVLIRVGADLVFHAAALAELRRILAPHKGQTFAVAQFKDWTNISRKYAIPLLEYLDRERVTRRTGNDRVVL